jgi:solute carrier family 30 (zinc transporter), member 9
MSLRSTQGFWPVSIAIGGNLTVTVIKFFAALASGSSVMFSEAIHSFADTLNQVFLLIGLRQSLKKPDDTFAYGYGNERFFWALISACGIFFVGAGITALRGIESLTHPHTIDFSFTIAVVLFASFLIELYTLRVAANQLIRSFPEDSWRERIDQADSATLAVLLEDTVAVIGVVIAAIAIGISYISGSTMWDALGSIVISIMLAGVAIFLIVKNRAYLLGKAMPEELEEAVIEMIEAEPSVKKVIDFKSAVIGLGVYRIKCEVEFNGSALLRESYRESSLRAMYEKVHDDLEEFKRFMSDYSDRIPRLMGKKIDHIEAKLRSEYPGIRHIDIEVN